MLTTGVGDPTLQIITFAGAWAIIKVSSNQHQCTWLAGGYDLEVGHFYRWLAWWLPAAGG